MRDCKAKYLVTKNAFLHNAKAAADLAGIDKIFLFDEPEKQENGVLGRFRKYNVLWIDFLFAFSFEACA